MRIMPFMKRKKGVQFAGIGIDSGGGGSSPTYTAGDGISIADNVISANLFNSIIGLLNNKSVVSKTYQLTKTISLPTTASQTVDIGTFEDSPAQILFVAILDTANGNTYLPTYAHLGEYSGGEKWLGVTLTGVQSVSISNPTIFVVYTKN